tara:strand:+ start:401 stop:661 length:261 start_codon:yes stop_codon:yes gene_type:complete
MKRGKDKQSKLITENWFEKMRSGLTRGQEDEMQQAGDPTPIDIQQAQAEISELQAEIAKHQERIAYLEDQIALDLQSASQDGLSEE